MFSSSSSVVKASPFDVYNTVQANFTSIKNLGCFTNYTAIPPNDLITISNITMDCIDKLSEMSIFETLLTTCVEAKIGSSLKSNNYN